MCAQLAIIYAIGNAVLAAVIKGLLVPALVWLFNDIWQRMPFNRWLGYVLIGFCIGIMTGIFLTLHVWLQKTSESLLTKSLTAISVIAGTCVFVFGSAILIKIFLPF